MSLKALPKLTKVVQNKEPKRVSMAQTLTDNLWRDLRIAIQKSPSWLRSSTIFLALVQNILKHFQKECAKMSKSRCENGYTMP